MNNTCWSQLEKMKTADQDTLAVGSLTSLFSVGRVHEPLRKEIPVNDAFLLGILRIV
jgi:hypothetical protein